MKPWRWPILDVSQAAGLSGTTQDFNSVRDLPFRGRPMPATWESERIATGAMRMVIVLAAIRNLFVAAAKPFWFDEVCTVIVARQPSFSAILTALKRGADGQPPLFYLVERIAAGVVPNAQIAYRLPAILGFCCILWFVFVFIRRRDGATRAFLCSTALLLTPLNSPYATEARPYAMVVACIALALVCYQRLDEGRRWILLLGLSMAIAESLHCYALFSFAPFAVAEIALAAKRRQTRWSVWMAMAFGMAPLAVYWPLLETLKRVYGLHLPNVPRHGSLAMAYSDLFGIHDLRFFPYGGRDSAAAIMLVVLAMGATALWNARNHEERDNRFHEDLLGIALLATPFVCLAAIKIGHAGFAARYSLPMILGVAIAGAYLLRIIGRRYLLLSLVGVSLFAVLAFQEVSFWNEVHDHFGRFWNATDSFELAVGSARHEDLPVVVSDGLAYMQVAYYATPEVAKRIVAVVDVPQAIAYAPGDSIDLELPALALFYPLQVYEFSAFAQDHPRFLLYSSRRPMGLVASAACP